MPSKQSDCLDCGRTLYRERRLAFECPICGVIVCWRCEERHVRSHPPEEGAAKRRSVTAADRRRAWTVAE